jgi:uncharacterized damage-inducible protein DinB
MSRIDTTFMRLQYDLVRESRNVLLTYCQALSPSELVHENPSFGRGGSIRNLLVHIANTYEFWIVRQALHQAVAFTDYASVNSPEDIAGLFDTIDGQMGKFMQQFQGSELDPRDVVINGISQRTTPFKLFTHVITHEFHHKGQILSISRQLGYTPVDTDIMR